MIAQKITPRVQQWLRNSLSARVLHLFDEVCTLVNDQDDVISLVSPRIGPGPFTAVLAGDFTSGLDVHQPVTLDNARLSLTVGPLVVDAEGAAVWQPRPDWSRLAHADWVAWPPAPMLPAALDDALKLTLDGIIAHDAQTCLAGVTRLAGRGRGLTPAGDDVLVGVLFGLWVWYPDHLQPSRQTWQRLIVSTAVPQTTTLAANFLRAAGDGEAMWPWHDLIDGRPGAVERILAMGHTSGEDAWAGFVATVAAAIR